MSHPLVTIITPSYNRDWIISQCLDSIKNQSYRNLEHIVVDGGSNDQTVALLKKAEQEYNLKWISDKDGGMYDAVNQGIKLAKGEIIAYLNTDDFYFPYTLETVVDIFNKTDADIVYGDWINLYYKSKNLEVLPWMDFNKYDLLSDYNLPQPTVFIKRTVFEKIGNFNLTYRLVADNEFFTRAALAEFKLIKIDEFLAGQIIHDKNLLAGNLTSRSIAKEEGRRYRRYYQDIYNISETYLLAIRITNKLKFRLNTNFNIVKFIYQYLTNDSQGSWLKFRGYLKAKNVSIDWTKLINYLLINSVMPGSYNRENLAFLVDNSPK
jgi:glycosyltransferase involved in cell wall biosynthesis